jgi:hypothetical protein
MNVSERVKTEMRTYQRHFQASVLFSHLPIDKEEAAGIVNVFLRFCADEGLTSPGLLEGLRLPRSHHGRTQAHALLGLLPETNKAEAIAVVEVFLGHCDDADLLPAAVHDRRELKLVTFPSFSGGNSPSLRAIPIDRPEIEPK